MLTNALKKLFLEIFYWENDKIINVLLTAFYISHESDVKTFLLWFINHCSKDIC